MTAEQTCNLDPFLSPVVAQIVDLSSAGSAVEILTQTLENWLARLKTAVCADMVDIVTNCCDNTPPDEPISFLDLTDTPASYSGAAGFGVAVNGSETALVFQALLDEFIELIDVPNSYTGSAGLAVAVKGDESGLEFVSFPVIPPPPTYFIEPRMVNLWPPQATTGQIGPAPTAVGGGQVQVPTNPGNVIAANYRLQLTTGAGANAVAGIRTGVFMGIRGTSAPMGGWRMTYRFGCELYAAGQRGFIGFSPNAAAFPAGNVDPSTLVNVVFLGFDAADTNWQVMHNDAAGACTKVNLTSHAINTTSLIEFILTCAPSGNITYLFRDLTTAVSSTGVLSTNLPAGGQPLGLQIQANAAATGTAARLSHILMIFEVGPS